MALLLPLDGISMLTVVPKWMPHVTNWSPYFDQFAKTGYNMVHFAPLNMRGSSNSPYSIYDQLAFSDDLFPENTPADEKDALLKNVLGKIRTDFGILTATDIVWNHTAFNSAWLQDHPEAGYNLKTAPHLRPAYEIDEALLQFSEDWGTIPGNKDTIETEEDLAKVLHAVRFDVLPKLRLWEFYVINVEKTITELRAALSDDTATTGRYKSIDLRFLSIQQQAEILRKDAFTDREDGTRFAREIDIHVAAEFTQKLAVDKGLTNVEDKIARFIMALDEMNLLFYRDADADLAVIVENVSSRAKYLRVEKHGPRLGSLSRENPLVDNYFTRLPVNAKTKNRDKDELVLANNGWIWNADPLVNFAAAGSKAYLRREVIAWGDCVKLRYGSKTEDSPWLWDHMKAYTKKMARTFNGLRIDNCHSTPIHVASALLDAAREENPDIYVFAELFSGSEEKDIMFVSKLGIHSLIREAMNAWDSKELSRLVHRFGGQPVGSLTLDPEHLPLELLGHDVSDRLSHGHLHEDLFVELKGSPSHALFMDCTHDNETPHQKRVAADTLPNAAIVAMTDSAVGSVLGYDEIVPELLNLVHETRKYFKPEFEKGIHPAKAVLYKAHESMARDGFSELHVNQDEDFLSIHRIHPITHEGYLLIARCAFHKNHSNHAHAPIVLLNQRAGLLLAATLTVGTDPPGNLLLSTNKSPFTYVEQAPHGDDDVQTTITIDPVSFVPGTIVLYKTSVNRLSWPPGLWEATERLTISDINVALYRCSAEEEDWSGDGAYDIPGHGKLPYCGLQGFVSALYPVARKNDLGHAIFSHLRNGPWMIDYIVGRLDKQVDAYPGLSDLRDWLVDRLTLVKEASPSFLPKYFTIVIFAAYEALRYRAIHMCARVQKTAAFSESHKSSTEALLNACLLMAFQMTGVVKSSGLVPSTYPTSLVRNGSSETLGSERGLALAAGLTHFATQYMRCWGRDIFISVPGFFIEPGHDNAARAHIIAFGSTLRHGLIPNLLDSGMRSRYNARDAAWWWLHSVAEYCRSSSEGHAFLGVKVARRFVPLKRYRNPDYLSVGIDDDNDKDADTFCEYNDSARAFVHSNTIAQLCHEILERHAWGISFREWNAGTNLDHAMRSEGFDVRAGVAWEKGGIVTGGSRWNCGTWMDKMGDSDKAGNKGVPSTPRDGAAVEIVGLAKATLNWVAKDVLGDGKGREWWKWDNATGKSRSVSYADWNETLGKAFEEHFYIPTHTPSRGVQRRGIYRDTVGATLDYMDYQLRPNFPMAMVVAPEMFDPDHARHALGLVKELLVGPLGIKTLDPGDWAYRGVYDNSDDGTDGAVAHGANYHQGPEWVYPLGFFLRAYLYFFTQAPGHDPSKIDEVYQYIQHTLLTHKRHILDTAESPYAGLPELTNRDGAYCGGSCATQAWSGAVMIELIKDLIDGVGKRGAVVEKSRLEV
ncbi:glucanotransferase domain of glycogen debranching enzyme-domain-containing protein [Fimicolochytrium jonesii]|uniref:glucanotransferase domain of glycogen debranching enzyme-domain-containing protein n=1 Tax=Fimicolochytrium jonesii TaxID=1396493 RepID=UPI0022FE4A84|nr:glucanotransferase domain of glycogen debranching enzyme-domain-containing protein [Fimicolochytrium jonesii]KAI8820466.1 glucanotransferase domain of glycogen debranching enzyme-domain-containing protein [Fimicolochytrium jonesii]